MIRILQANEEYPWTLLLDADPDRDLVANYLKNSRVLVHESMDAIIGVIVYQERETEWEIMNLAVAPERQGQGIGGQLLEAVFASIKEISGEKPILIKTGDLTSPALKLYQAKGFQQIGLVKDYFIDNYPEPIYENGQLLRNQVILRRSVR